jgi:hypothetical protein
LKNNTLSATCFLNPLFAVGYTSSGRRLDTASDSTELAVCNTVVISYPFLGVYVIPQIDARAHVAEWYFVASDIRS